MKERGERGRIGSQLSPPTPVRFSSSANRRPTMMPRSVMLAVVLLGVSIMHSVSAQNGKHGYVYTWLTVRFVMICEIVLVREPVAQ